MILLIFAGPACLALNIRIDLPNLQFIHGWYQKSHGVVYIWTMLLISWVQIGWYSWMLTPDTLVSNLRSTFPIRVPLTYWSKTFQFLGFHIPSLLTMLRALHPKNSKEFCKERGIIHLMGAPYHPSTNGAAERLLQTFKQALRKSVELPKKALLGFLRQYRRTPTDSGFSPSQLLNGRQIRTKLDTILPSSAHIMQGK